MVDLKNKKKTTQRELDFLRAKLDWNKIQLGGLQTAVTTNTLWNLTEEELAAGNQLQENQDQGIDLQ